MQKFIFLILIFASAFASHDNNQFELATFGGEPSTIVDGCVSAITGDYFINEEDMVVNAREPIRIKRQYFSGNGTDYHCGWRLFFHPLVATRYKIFGGTFLLSIPEKYGFNLLYASKPHKRGKGQYKYNIHEGYPSSLTNCHTGEISGRLNTKNNRVYDDPKSHRQIIVDGADGGKRIYHCHGKLDQYPLSYNLIWERLPNENTIHYDWNKIGKKHYLTSITTKSSEGKTYAKVDIYYKIAAERLYTITLKGSDGQTLIYKLYPHAKQHNTRHSSLSKVIRPMLPDEEISHWGADTRGFLTSLRKFPDGRFSYTDYFKLDDVKALIQQSLPPKPQPQPQAPLPKKPNPFNPDHIRAFGNRIILESKNKIEESVLQPPKELREENIKKDARYKRVKALQGPVGPHGEEEAYYTFSYNPGKYQSGGGTSKVTTAYGDTTHYSYNKYFLPSQIYHCIGEDLHFFHEFFEWHPHNSDKPNWLKRKTIADGGRDPIITYDYEYDGKGNVIREHLTGNLTGEGGLETYTIHRTFTHNNLVSSETFPNGKRIEYTYLRNTDLPTAKYIYDNNQLKIRHFYIYSGNVLTEEITDDGNTKNIHNLSGVTRRLSKTITPHPETDLPEIIAQYYLDLSTKTRILLSKKVLHTDNRRLVIQSDHYNKDNTLLYSLHYTYDHKRRLIKQTDPLGRVKTLSYDANNNIIFSQDSQEAFSETREYNLRNRITHLTQKPGEEKSYSKHFRYHYDQMGRKIDETNYLEKTTQYQYDPFGNIATIHYPSMYDIRTKSSKSPIKQFTNTILGMPLTEVDAEGNVTKKEWTIRNQPYHITYPDQAEESLIYDLNGNLIKHTNPIGTVTVNTYDFLDRLTSKKIYSKENTLLSEESFIYNSFALLSKTASDGTKTSYTYDGAGRKIKETTLSHTTYYTYDSSGRLHTTILKIDPNHSQVHVKKYDILDRIVEEREEDQNGTLYSCTKYTYDEYGNKSSITIDNSTETYEYNAFRELTKKVDPLGNTTTITLQIEPLSSKYYPKKTALKRTTTDPNGNSIVEFLINPNQIALTSKFSSDSHLIFQEISYYDLNHNQIKQITKARNGKETTQTWSYDSRSRLTTLIEEEGKVTKYSYRADGLRKTLTQPDGVTIHYSYNPLGNLTRITAPDIDYHLTYDILGNITSFTDGQTTITRTYDPFGNLLKETFPHHITLTRTYDALNRPTTLTLPGGSSIHYQYDPYHLLSINRLSPQKDLLYTHQYPTYDLRHHPTQEILPNGIPLTHHIDPLNRITQTTSPYSLETVTTFDPNGNVLEYLRHLDTTTESLLLTYDPLNQITSESGLFDHTYTHDSYHNRLAKDDNTYTYDKLHQLLDSPDSNYTHSPNGNLIQENGAIYTYDSLGRLITLKTPQKTLAFTYDYWNRLLSYTDQTQTTHLLYDDQKELGTQDTLRILNPTYPSEIGATIAIEHDSQTYIPLHDLFGNIIALLDQDSHPVETYRHSSFGEEILSHTPLNPWRYQSKRKIAHLHYFGHRFYHPDIARFITPDPKGYAEGPNLYQYNYNNPYRFTDHFGEAAYHMSFPPLPTMHPEAAATIATEVISNPHVQGGLQAFTGLAEVGAGATMAYASGGLAAPLGWLAIAHGFDHFITGMNQAFNGAPIDTATSTLLQHAGMSRSWANCVDYSASFGLITKGAAVARAAQLGYSNFYQFPIKSPNALTTSQENHLFTSSTKAYDQNLSQLAHSFSKHAGRHPENWGKIKGPMNTWHDQAFKHLKHIYDAPGKFRKVTDSKTGLKWIEKRLPDGRGVRLNQDYTFKGFVD